MANDQQITEIISEAAFAQLDRLQEGLERSAEAYAKFAGDIIKQNKDISGASSMKDLDKALKDQIDTEAKLTASKAKLIAAQNRLEAATTRQIKLAEQKAAADLKAQSIENQRADNAVRMSVKVASASDSEYDANMKVAVSEKDLERGRRSAAAAAMDASKDTATANKEMAASALDAEKSNSIYLASFRDLIRQSMELRSELKETQEQIKTMDNLSPTGVERLVAQEVELRNELQRVNLEMNRAAKEQALAETSSESLAIRLDRLRAAWRKMTDEERDNTDAGKELEAQIKSLDEQLKNLDQRVGVNNRSVGDYKIATEDLTNALTKAFPVLDSLKTEFENYSGIMTASIKSLKTFVTGSNSATAATGKMSAGLKALRIALISTGIGAIVVILGSLIAYLTTTEEGMDRVTAVTRPLQAVMRALLGVLQLVGKALFDAFTNPKKAAEDIYNFMKNEVMPVFKSYLDILIGVATLNFDRTKEGIQGITDAARNATSAVSDFFSEAWKTGQDIDEIMKDINNSEIELIETQGALNRRIREQGEIARDMSKSEAVRKKAAQEAIDAVNELAEKEISIAQKRIQLIQLENKDTLDSYESRRAIAEAQVKIDEIRDNQSMRRIELTSALNRAERQGETAAEKARREAERQAKIQQSLTERQYELMQQLYSLEEERANRSSENYKRIADDERRSLDDRFDATMLYLDEREKAITNAYEREALEISERLSEATKLEAIGRKEEAVVIRSIVENELIALSEREKQLRLELALDRNEELLKLAKQSMSKETAMRVDAINEEAQQTYDALARSYRDRGISETQFAYEREALANDTAKKLLEIEIENVQNLIEVSKTKGIGVEAEERALADLKIRLAKQTTDTEIKEADRLLEREKQINEARKEMYTELAGLSANLFAAGMEREAQRIETEQTNIQTRHDKEIEAIQSSTMAEEEKQSRIFALESQFAAKNEELEKRKADVKMRQARLDKAIAIGNIISHTAQGIVSALAMFPPNIPLSVIIGATGAAQLAGVLAQPLPQYYKGTSSSKEGFAHVGERGTELMIDPSGKMMLTPNQDTITYLRKGTKILTHEQTKRALTKRSVSGGMGSSDVSLDMLVAAYNKGSNSVVSAIKGQKNSGTFITKSGWHKTQMTNDKFNAYLKRNGLK